MENINFFDTELTAHSEFYYNLLDKLSIVAITDRAGNIIYANDMFCSISGYSRDELMGTTHRIINSGYHSKAFFIDLWKTISAGKIWRGEIKNKAKNGNYYWVDTFIIPELDEQGEIEQYYSVRIDITQRKVKERELNSHKEELEHIRLLQSHQIRKPVANILGLVGLIDSEALNDKNKLIFEMLKESASEFERSIRNIVEKQGQIA